MGWPAGLLTCLATGHQRLQPAGKQHGAAAHIEALEVRHHVVRQLFLQYLVAACVWRRRGRGALAVLLQWQRQAARLDCRAAAEPPQVPPHARCCCEPAHRPLLDSPAPPLPGLPLLVCLPVGAAPLPL